MPGTKTLLFFLVFFTTIPTIFSQENADTSVLVLKSKFELGFTPRFAFQQDYKISPTDSSFYHNVGWYRLQAGMQIHHSHYVHLFIDYYRVRTDLDFLSKTIDAIGFGIQYSLKFEDAIVRLPPIRLYKKPIHIRWYPEILASAGLINLANMNFKLSGLHQTKKYYFYAQYGIAWNFYINKWAHISLLYLQEYLPSVKSDPYHYAPLQTKFVIKL